MTAAWTAALLRIDRAVRGLPPLPESLEADVVEILNGIAATVRALTEDEEATN